MLNRNAVRALLAVLTAAGLAAGCSTSGPSDLEARLEARDKEVESLQASVRDRDSRIQSLSSELASAQVTPDVAARPPSGATGDLLPPNAEAGECYARVFVPAVYETEELRLLKREASERIETVEARYESAEERVLVKETSERLEVVPATYRQAEEQVLVKPASTKIVEVPAVYDVEEERILDRPAHTVWKKGRGPIERIDQATGEIMCLVEMPATYKTVRKRVLTSPATTREVTIPAEYETVRRRVMDTPPSTRKIEIPAEYKTVRVHKLVTPASTQRFDVPAEYQTVTKRKLVRDGAMAWRSILCETNAAPGLISSLQRALGNAGHDPGSIDGVLGQQTLSAVRSFQREKGLPSGQLTVATLKALGVEAGR